MRPVFEALRIVRDGRVQKARLLFVAVPLLLFVLWRLSSHGVAGSDTVLLAIERDLISEYRTAQYRAVGLLDDDAASRPPGAVGAPEIDGLEVRLSSVSMSGSLFSWSANDAIGIRFDYVIERNGEVKASARSVYRCTGRRSRTQLWECGAVSYYLRYL